MQLPIQPLLFRGAQCQSTITGSSSVDGNQSFLPEIFTRRARALAADLRGDSTDDLVKGLLPKVYEPTILLRAAVPVCGKIWSPVQNEILAERLLDVAEMTISHLPPDLMKGVWIEPKWHQCKVMPDDFTHVPSKCWMSWLGATILPWKAQSREWLEKHQKVQRCGGILRQWLCLMSLSPLAREERWGDVITAEKVLG